MVRMPNCNNLEEIPPKVYTAIALRSSTSQDWGKCAELADIRAVTLRKYRKYPQVRKYLDDLNKERLKDCRNIVSAAMPTVLKRLVKTATDEKERAYARNQASEILIKYESEREDKEELNVQLERLELRQNALEGNKVIDIN